MTAVRLRAGPDRQAEPAGPVPHVPSGVGAAASTLSGWLSRLRGARVFHPKGVGYSATLIVDRPQPEYAGAPLFVEAMEHPALVRLSYAAGLPDRWPDALGLALRLLDVHGPGRHQDFLLITSGARPLTQHLILPAPRGFTGHSYSTLLPYRIGDRLRVMGARPHSRPSPARDGALPALVRTAASGTIRFDLTLGTFAGRRHAVAELVVEDRLDDDLVERLAFNPWNTGGGVRPAGPLQGLRRPSYAGSQSGRDPFNGPIGS
jgi:hypothetical protein